MHLTLVLLKLFTQASIVMGSLVLSNSSQSLEEVSFTHPAGLKIVPFDAKKMLKLEEGLKDFPPLGPVRVIRGLMSSPSFFPISLSVYSRSHSLTNIYLKPVDHLVTAEDGTKSLINYHYNLNQLLSPQNPFKPDRRTIIVVAGYMSGMRVQWMQDVRESWLQLEDVNVILVYWPDGNKGLYSTAVSNVKLVARQVTIFLYYLSQVNGIDFKSVSFRESISLVGHSLGAHVAAFVGQELDGQVGRITGLDPAGPIFDKQKNIDRIDPTDAILVDILHTNGGKMRYVKAGIGFIKMTGKKLLEKVWSKIKGSETKNTSLVGSLLSSHVSDDEAAWFGLENPAGHLDYYANGGSIQPGCNDNLHLCDHRRAHLIYRHALQFELRARQVYGSQSEPLRRGHHRLVAFPSSDYASFRSGSSIMRNCPMLITNSNLMNAQTRKMAYKQCTVPMDFVTPGPELKRQLEEDYGLPLSSLQRLPDRPLSDWRFSDFENRRLYFETMSRDPLVGEHHLMQIHLDRNQRINWDEGCRFTCKIDSNNDCNLFSLIDYKFPNLEPVEFDQFYGLCFLLANPNDWRNGSQKSDEAVADTNDSSTALFLPDEPKARSPRHSPSSMNMEVSYNGVTLNNIRVVSNESRKRTEQCSMNINFIETRPLTTLVYNVASWYNNNGQSDSESDPLLHSKNGYSTNLKGGLIFPTKRLSRTEAQRKRIKV